MTAVNRLGIKHHTARQVRLRSSVLIRSHVFSVMDLRIMMHHTKEPLVGGIICMLGEAKNILLCLQTNMVLFWSHYFCRTSCLCHALTKDVCHLCILAGGSTWMWRYLLLRMGHPPLALLWISKFLMPHVTLKPSQQYLTVPLFS